MDKSSPNLKKPQEFIRFEVFFPCLGWTKFASQNAMGMKGNAYAGLVEKLAEIYVEEREVTNKNELSWRKFCALLLVQCMWLSALANFIVLDTAFRANQSISRSYLSSTRLPK